MSPSHSMPPGTTAIVPDIHQNVAFVRAVRQRIQDISTIREVVFLGDYVDGRGIYTGRRSLARTLRELRAIGESGLKCTFLCGNHEAMYLAAFHSARLRFGPEIDAAIRSGCVGSPEMGKVARVLHSRRDWHWLRRRLCFAVARGDYLISHAGLHATNRPMHASDPTSAAEWVNTLAKQHLHNAETQPLLGPGRIRGGNLPVGGILWQDFNAEFEDNLPFPQIVGHTAGDNVRWNGRSCCLDASQTRIGLLHPDARLEIIPIPPTDPAPPQTHTTSKV